MMIEKDIFATNVYTLGYQADGVANLDFTKKIIDKQCVTRTGDF